MANQELLLRLKSYLEDRFSKVTVGEKRLSLSLGMCYTASMVASEILKKIGYDCYVTRVEVFLGNEIWRRLSNEQEERGSKCDPEEIFAKGGYTIGLGMEKRKEYHYVVYFPEQEEVMDLTFGQISRPEHGIINEAYWRGMSELPESILGIWETKPDLEWERGTLYNAPELKKYLEDIIKNGYELFRERYGKLQ